MKNKNTAINKIIKNFDKELKNLILTDLKVMRVAKTTLTNNLSNLDRSLNHEKMMIA